MLLLQTVASPIAVFRLLRLHPRWATAAILLSSLHALLTILPALFQRNAVVQVPVISSAVLLVVFWMFFKWISATMVLHFLILLKKSGENSKTFKKALTVVIHSSVVQTLSWVVAALLGVFLLVLGYSTRFGFVSFASLGIVCSSFPIPKLLSSYLMRIDIFSIWHLFLLTIGTRTVFSVSSRTAFLLASIVWLFLSTAQIAMQEYLKFATAAYLN